jgi:ribose/xylose/arabinose/galactoside ABC-type transport system permease subunit
MMQNLSTFFSRNRRLLPLSATIVLFFMAYALGAVYLPGMRDMQVFLNLFNQTPYLLVSVIGETLVVISGGIDLSVGGMVALTTTASAALLRTSWNPWVVMLLMLAMGTAMGAIMGYFITYLKVQPFIATLAGMWIGRGLSYFISNDSIAIDNRIYALLARTKILIPGLSDVVAQKGDYITPSVVIGMAIFAAAIYIAHYTRFGRTIYSLGGNNGANEQSARLMGLPVDRTKVLVYTFNGFCSAMAGILLSIYTGSGHGAYGNSLELTVIAAVVIGGTALTGGEGYVFGALFGVLITILIQTMIQIQGQLISWWTLIMVGVITLFFIGLQAVFANLKIGQTTGKKQSSAKRNRQLLLFGGGTALVIVLVGLAFAIVRNTARGSTNAVASTATSCQLKAFRQDQALSLMNAGAVITYERNGGANCIDELHAIYPDGRIVSDNGVEKIEKQVTPEDVDKLLSFINNLGWFTDNMYSTSHLPCKVCYTYFTSVAYNGQEKSVKAVDGGTDAPAEYWLMTGQFSTILPIFAPTP